MKASGRNQIVSIYHQTSLWVSSMQIRHYGCRKLGDRRQLNQLHGYASHVCPLLPILHLVHTTLPTEQYQFFIPSVLAVLKRSKSSSSNSSRAAELAKFESDTYFGEKLAGAILFIQELRSMERDNSEFIQSPWNSLTGFRVNSSRLPRSYTLISKDNPDKAEARDIQVYIEKIFTNHPLCKNKDVVNWMKEKDFSESYIVQTNVIEDEKPLNHLREQFVAGFNSSLQIVHFKSLSDKSLEFDITANIFTERSTTEVVIDIPKVISKSFYTASPVNYFALQSSSAEDKREPYIEKSNQHKALPSDIPSRPGKVLLGFAYMHDPNAMKEDEIPIHANMPGRVVKIMVHQGAEIKKGDPVAVLEAMKMETVLRSPCSGKVSSIKCKQGESVTNGQLLLAIDGGTNPE